MTPHAAPGLAPALRDANGVYQWTRNKAAMARVLLQNGVSPGVVTTAVGCRRKDLELKFPHLIAEVDAVERARTEEARRFSEREVETAATLAALGAGTAKIAKLLGTSEARLVRECGSAMDLAVLRINAHAARFLFKQMQRGDTRAIIFWLKTRGGNEWRETQHLQIEGGAGVLIAPAGLDPEKWIEAEAVRTAEGGTSDAPVTAGERERFLEGMAESAAAGAVAPWDAEDEDAEIALPEYDAPRVGDLGGGLGDEDLEDLFAEEAEEDEEIDVLFGVIR